MVRSDAPEKSKKNAVTCKPTAEWSSIDYNEMLNIDVTNLTKVYLQKPTIREILQVCYPVVQLSISEHSFLPIPFLSAATLFVC